MGGFAAWRAAGRSAWKVALHHCRRTHALPLTLSRAAMENFAGRRAVKDAEAGSRLPACLLPWCSLPLPAAAGGGLEHGTFLWLLRGGGEVEAGRAAGGSGCPAAPTLLRCDPGGEEGGLGGWRLCGNLSAWRLAGGGREEATPCLRCLVLNLPRCISCYNLSTPLSMLC